MTNQAVCCYRHPDRETGIRCVRCDRPICPECMIDAAVGFQCPECLRDGQRDAPQPRTVGGGTIARDPHLLTKILIGLNIAVFIAVQAVGNRLVGDLGLYAVCDTGRCIGVAEGPGQWYRLLTSAFLHEAVAHIGLNMLALWWVGAPLEGMLGRARYLALYLVSALGGSALVMLVPPNAITLGASGAIFGLFGATAVFVRRMRYDIRPVLFLLALNLLFTFTWGNISWQGHVGGLVAGTLTAIGMAYAPTGPRRSRVQWSVSTAVLVLVLVATFVGVARITG
jgi:membrane associated rhomboid family serine protease